jgi:HK97 family phage portal protein
MRIFGFDISLRKAVPEGLQPPPADRTWFPIIREPFTGAWQRNLEQRAETVATYHAVYACITLIASDIAKMRLRLVEQDRNGIWQEVDRNSPFWPVLRKPNRYQNRIKFIEQWIVSKLMNGNTYVLKGRNEANVVNQLYVLDPYKTKALIAPDGDVYYQLSKDNLSGIEEQTIHVPASEIIHDVMVPLYHPLCGVSPLTACGIAAVQGLAMQNHSAKFFNNGAQPSGILTAPGDISDEMARTYKQAWEENYTGTNAGRVAVLGGGLKYEAMSVNSTDSQLIEQLQWTAKAVCSAFHVPPYMVGVGDPPSYNNIEALNSQYYTQCLQALIESIELLLDEGLGLSKTIDGSTYGTEFDLDDLLRMDTATQVEALTKAVGGSVMTPNVALKKLGQSPVKGGDTIYMQQQNFSLEALSKRDAKEDPFDGKEPAAKPTPALPAPAPQPAKTIDFMNAVKLFEAA